MRRDFAKVRRVVVKVGSAVLAPDGVLSGDAVRRLAADLNAVIDGGRQVVLVTSGAVASGFLALGLERPPREIALKQAAAALGQPRLMREYAEAFAFRTRPNLAARHVAQVLLTAEDLGDRQRFLNARHTLQTLVEHHAVPIINENDSVSCEEIKLGDNDRLSALVAGLISADLLVILSSVPGVFAGGIMGGPVVSVMSPDEDGGAHVGAGKSAVGTGGMGTKLTAVATARAAGVATVIASGLQAGVVADVLGGRDVGTYFPVGTESGNKRQPARRHWILFSAQPRGGVVVDAGAVRALEERGASLLALGVRAVRGVFEEGSVVEVMAEDGRVLARGMTPYSSADLERIKGLRGDDISGVLGFSYREEVIHRDDLALLADR